MFENGLEIKHTTRKVVGLGLGLVKMKMVCHLIKVYIIISIYALR